MSFGFVYFASILNLFCLTRGLQDESFGELCFVCVLYRHGDRAPLGYYPSDPHKDISFWPNGWGQLTKLGKLQQYELGQWIRHRYWDFLPTKYNASDIYVRSTDVDRTLASAYCNLAGLYECDEDENEEAVVGHAIPVHTTPVKMDSVLSGDKYCPAYDRLFEHFLESEEVCMVDNYYQEVFCNLSAYSGLNIKSVTDCMDLHSILQIQSLHGMLLPNWTKNYFPEPLQEMAEFAFKLPCFTTPLKRLKCGPLLRDIIQHMEDKKANKIPQKMWMYSGHDATLANLMQCMDVYDGVIPPFTATLIFELFKVEKEYYVVISYKTPTTFRVLRLPCCERFCPLSSFKKILQAVIPLDWDSECVDR